MIRGRDGKVRIFINSCLHRGALVCRQDSGNSSNFICFYHGWAYDNSGRLIGVPDPEGYAEDFKTSGRTLVQPAHVDDYRGLYFVNFAKDAPTLPDFLGEARELIDLTMDSAEILGGWQVIRGTAKYDIHANWKLLLENSFDNCTSIRPTRHSPTIPPSSARRPAWAGPKSITSTTRAGWRSRTAMSRW